MLKKFSVTYVKQHPVMFGMIFLVFGLFLWLLLNRGASAPAAQSGAVASGPSDQEIAANVALQQAQLAANVQIATAQLGLQAHADDNQAQRDLAALALQAQIADIQANYNLGKLQTEASLDALSAQLSTNLALSHDNNAFMLDYAKNAQDAATAQLLIGANLQATLGSQQLEAFKFSSLTAVIPTLKSGKRDNAFALLTQNTYGGGTTGAQAAQIMAPNGASGGGGFNPLNVISPVTNLIH